VQAVFAEAIQAQGKFILFAISFTSMSDSRTSTITSQPTAAVEANHLTICGATPEAYSAYIAPNASIARLFESISIDCVMKPLRP